MDPINAYIMELLNIALDSASALPLQESAMTKTKEQIKVQTGRLQEKYARVMPESKEILEKSGMWLTNTAPDSSAEIGMGEDMSCG